MKFINPTLHGALDYIAALALIALPYILGLQQVELFLSVAAGVGLIVYSLITDYALSIAKLVPFNLHITFDTLAAIVFISAPFALGFSSVGQIYYVVMGVGVLAVVAFSSKPHAQLQAS